jgi:hypothetical protein
MRPRSATTLLAAGLLASASGAGVWEDGRETYYVEDPQAVVRLKE